MDLTSFYACANCDLKQCMRCDTSQQAETGSLMQQKMKTRETEKQNKKQGPLDKWENIGTWAGKFKMFSPYSDFSG